MTQIYFEDIELGYEIDPVVKQPSPARLQQTRERDAPLTSQRPVMREPATS